MSPIHYSLLKAEHIPQAIFLLHNVFHYIPVIYRWDPEDLEEMIDIFQEGSMVALDGENVVGIGMGIFADFDFDNIPETEEDIIYPNDSIYHNPNGAYYYGTDLAVDSNYRGRRIARRLYEMRKEVVVRHNRRGFIAAAALPGFENEKHRMTVETYIDRVLKEEIFDPTLTVQLRNDFKVIKPLKNYFHHPASDHSSALIYWENDQYEE